MYRRGSFTEPQRFVAFRASIALAAALEIFPSHGADFTVRTPNNQFSFQINGVDNLTLRLVRGRTYVFDVQTSPGYHPFNIYSPGVDVNGIESGAIRYTVPTNNANYFYDCIGHSGVMRGEIVTVPPADFEVRTSTAPLAFRINGADSPTLTLLQGKTYVFDVETTIGAHLFHIESPGVNGNDIDSGRMTFAVPFGLGNRYYDCGNHDGLMRGLIVTIPPPQPPTFRILSLEVGSNLVLTSTGTNGWTVNPEFTTNRLSSDWQSLAVRTNRFRNGTNEVICGRPPGSNVFIRLRAQQDTLR